MKTMNLFMYGTLRVGHWNHPMLSEGVISSYMNVTTEGKLYYAKYRDMQAGFPCARFDHDGIIVGDLLVVDAEHEGVQDTHRMEIGAGYVPRDIVINLEDGTPMPAVGWQWKREELGKHIVTGDWERERFVDY